MFRCRKLCTTAGLPGRYYYLHHKYCKICTEALHKEIIWKNQSNDWSDALHSLGTESKNDRARNLYFFRKDLSENFTNDSDRQIFMPNFCNKLSILDIKLTLPSTTWRWSWKNTFIKVSVLCTLYHYRYSVHCTVVPRARWYY